MAKYYLDYESKMLENFFDKYDYEELAAFESIFEFIKDNDISNIEEAEINVYVNKLLKKEKSNKSYKEVINFKLSDLKRKNPLLNDEEVQFFFELTNAAYSFISNDKELLPDDKEEIDELSSLTKSLEIEMSKRYTYPSKRKVLKP